MILLPNFVIKDFHKLFFCFLCFFSRLFEEGLFFLAFFELYQRLDDQVAYINSWVALGLISVV